MKFINALLTYLQVKNTPNTFSTPEGFCPNCWGREEYGGHFYARVKQENLNVNSSTSNVGWVQAYANKHLLGIVLKRTGNGEALICGKCSTSYQHSDVHTNY